MADHTAELRRVLRAAGCRFVRQGKGDHEFWFSPITKKNFPVDSKIKSRHAANGVLKQAGITKNSDSSAKIAAGKAFVKRANSMMHCRSRCLLPFLLAIEVLVVVPMSAPSARAADDLTLKRVVLSSGGVGYYEFEAEVEGDARLALPVRLDQVDDVLKSVVVEDGRGAAAGAAAISLPGREPLAQIFRDLPLDPEALGSLAKLLAGLRGAEIRATGARWIEGRLLDVAPETVALPDGMGTTTRHRVGVMTAAGAQQFVLEEAETVELVDPELRAQIEAALAALAAHRARERRTLEITAPGEGRGTVRVAYVVAAPLWKNSYRLTLPPASAADAGDGDGPTAALQGWAVVENMSGRDWEGVELTLLSGNPVTFRQDLYTAYYVDRPEVPVEVLGRVLPTPDAGAVADAPSGGAGAAGPREFRRRDAPGFAARALRPEMGIVAAAPPTAPAESLAATGDEARDDAGASLAAEADEAATQVVFRFPNPVSVEAGRSLLLPIVDREVPAERLALYQPEAHARHPLATVRLTNDGETGLPPGVLTLYERAGGPGEGRAATTYVGDARLTTLPAGEERLVSFALDQKTAIDREDRSRRTIAKGRISRGVLELTVVDEQSTLYRLKAPPREGRLVVIEHPRRPGWDLVEPAEEDVTLTPDRYRVRHRLAAGEESRLTVTLRRPRAERIELLDLSSEDLAFYAGTGELDEPLRRAFVRMGELRGRIDAERRRLDELDDRRARIVEEQERVRDNLARVPSNSDLHRRYLAKLNRQEDELERLEAEIDAARADLNRARDALTDYVAGLTI